MTAVHFIADLERREEAAFPGARHHSAIDILLNPKTFGNPGSIPLNADQWADHIMLEAEEKGIDGVYET